MPDFIVNVHSEIPHFVPARSAIAGDARTSAAKLTTTGGSERRIDVPVQAADRAAATATALQVVREVLGDLVTGELWVESTEESAG